MVGSLGSWSLDCEDEAEFPPIHLGRFNTLGGAQVLRLDDWAAREQPPKVDFLKMDVDGYEIDVIEGAAETLSRYNPVMMKGCAPYIFSERGRSFKELLDALLALGYARTVNGKPLRWNPPLRQRFHEREA